MHVDVNKMILYSLFALEIVTVEKNQPATIQNANKSVRDALKFSKSRSEVPNSSVQQASFSPMIAVLMPSRGVASNEAEEAVATSLFCARTRAHIGDII